MLLRLTFRSLLIWLLCLLLGICWASPVKEKWVFLFVCFRFLNKSQVLDTLDPTFKSRRTHPHPYENQEKNLLVNFWSTQWGQLQQSLVSVLTLWNPGWWAQNSASYSTMLVGAAATRSCKQALPPRWQPESFTKGATCDLSNGAHSAFLRQVLSLVFWNQNLSKVNVT